MHAIVVTLTSAIVKYGAPTDESALTIPIAETLTPLASTVLELTLPVRDALAFVQATDSARLTPMLAIARLTLAAAGTISAFAMLL